ncbi:MAG: NADH-quinone oxidoreductase subunit G [Pseudomonadaceae bacterium]|nr:NADH-quinone oxidoreductase subunit G [Pseudomonadaceae bacterium]
MTTTPLPPAPEGMLNVYVDGRLVHVRKGATVMDACKAAEQEVPHFCYHKRLSVAGNCRMCMVEIEGFPKPVASCHWPAAEGMKVRTDSETATTARKGTMEFLLINHPLDCPICDQGGECTLQDLSVAYGGDRSHFHEGKRAVDDKDIGAKIKTVMTRCIHCTRCIRFATEIAGVQEMGATGRGEAMQVGTYVESALTSELAGNMIDLCPVGALTNRPFAYTARPWELVGTDTIDVLDAVGGHIRLDARAGKVMRAVPRECDAINEEWMTDAARFSTDALSSNRLTAPQLRKGRGKGKLENTGWAEAFAAIKEAVRGVRKTRLAGLMDNLHSAEDGYAFRAFMQDALGSDNVDSRMAGNLVDSKSHAAGICNTPFKRWDDADAVLLVGCNPRLEAPLLNIRLRRVVKKGAPVFVVGEVADLTYPVTHLGDTAKELETLLDGKTAAAKALAKAERPLIVVGGAVLARPDGRAIVRAAGELAEKVAMTDSWNGFNVLHDTCGRITALDMAVHPAHGGMATAEILENWRENHVDVLFLYGDCDLTPADLAGGRGTLVYIGTHATPLAAMADVVLPAAAWSEKEGLFANAEGRVQATRAAVPPPLSAKEDWKIFRALSEQVGDKLPFDTLAQLRAAIAEFCPAYAPEAIGTILPAPWQGVGKKGKLTAKPLASSVGAYYLRTAHHRESAWMKTMQAEVAPVQEEAA